MAAESNGLLQTIVTFLNTAVLNFIARTSPPGSAVNGAQVQAVGRLDGVQFVDVNGIPGSQYNIGTTLTDDAEGNIVVGSTGLRPRLNDLTLLNTDSVAHTVTIKSSTGGGVVDVIVVPAAVGSIPGTVYRNYFPGIFSVGLHANFSATVGEVFVTGGSHVQIYGRAMNIAA